MNSQQATYLKTWPELLNLKTLQLLALGGTQLPYTSAEPTHRPLTEPLYHYTPVEHPKP